MVQIRHKRHKIKEPLSVKRNLVMLRAEFWAYRRQAARHSDSANSIRNLQRRIGETYAANDREGGRWNVIEIAAYVGLSPDELERLRERVKDGAAPGLAALCDPTVLATLVTIADIFVRADPPPDDGALGLVVIARPVDRRAAIRQLRGCQQSTAGPPEAAVQISDPASLLARGLGVGAVPIWGSAFFCV